MPQGDDERTWLERELTELRAREAGYRESLSRRDAEAERLRAHSDSLHQLLRRNPPSRRDLTRTLVDVARLSAQALRIERSSVWYFDSDRRTLRCTLQLIESNEVTPEGLALTCESCQTYVRALSENSVVAVRDVYDDLRTAELIPYLREHRIGALLDIPIVIAGELIGVVCHEHVGSQRVWEPGEVELAAMIGQLVALALETERRIRAEYAERESEAKYQYLVESLPVTVYSFDAESGQLDYLSPRARELGGQPLEVWLKEGVGAWLRRIHPDDRPPVMYRFERGIAGGFEEEVTYRVRLDDGRTRWVRDTCRVVRDAAGKPFAIQGVLSDVTEHTSAELARQEIERRYQALLANVDVIALGLDLQGRVTFANDAFVRVSGFSREQLVGLDWFDVVLPQSTRDAVRKRFLEDTAQGRVAPRFELTIITRTGDQRQLLSTNTLLRSADGTLEGTLSIAVDVTEHRALESEILQQTKLESLGRLAAGVAHDFNNLLTVLLGQVTRLRTLGLTNSGAEAPVLLDTIDRAIEQASELTRSLLLYGRKQVERPELFLIDSLVLEALPLLEALAGREVKVSTSLHSDDARLMLDRARVRQALLNLVGNAADATRGHGASVRVSTHVELLSEAVARGKGASGGGSFVVLSVADDGRGMDPRTIARVFEPFFTTKAEGRGTGLGLAITQAVATQAGGFVEVESSLGDGTTFRMFLPTREPRASSVAPSPSAVPSPIAPVVRVLVVDDMKPIRELVSETLREAGYDTIAVGDTRTAAEMLGSTQIDLLITDRHLPDGSGEVLARSARMARPSLRVIVMSGSGDGEAFDGALHKPFVVSTLLRVVKEVLAAAPE